MGSSYFAAAVPTPSSRFVNCGELLKKPTTLNRRIGALVPACFATNDEGYVAASLEFVVQRPAAV